MKDVRRETQNSLPAVERSVRFFSVDYFIISPSILKHTPVYYISLSLCMCSDPVVNMNTARIQEDISRYFSARVHLRHYSGNRIHYMTAFAMLMVFMHSCRLQAESMSWESLLNKHRSKADELDK